MEDVGQGAANATIAVAQGEPTASMTSGAAAPIEVLPPDETKQIEGTQDAPASQPQQSPDTPPAQTIGTAASAAAAAVAAAEAQPQPGQEQPQPEPIDVSKIAMEAAQRVIETLGPEVRDLGERVKKLEESAPPDAAGVKDIHDRLEAITTRIKKLGLD